MVILDQMKKCSWFFACLLTLTVTAQERLVVMGTPHDLYVVHTTSEGESLQSISNQFGQSVTKLSTYNSISGSAVLAKGVQVKIPLTQYNLIRVKGDNNSAPVYHIIQKGDNLYRISKTNGVTVAVLKEWNNLKTDIVKDGQAIIVGYMVNAKVSALPGDKKEEPVKDINTDEPKKVEPVNPASVKPSGKKVPPAKKAAAVAVPSSAEPDAKVITGKPGALPGKKEESSVYVPKEGDEGYFAVLYAQHPKEQSQQFHSGDAATFKTISGWTDRKYYVLINDVAPETIVRITAPNNKSICAKVLGPLQETKGGSGLLLRMSNSAASTLGITDSKFTVTVTFYE
jgi:LysM repeat protein